MEDNGTPVGPSPEVSSKRYRPATATPLDQLRAGSSLEFVELLNLLLQNAGVSAGVIAERSQQFDQGKLSRSQVYSILDKRRGVLPRRGEQVRTYAMACGLDDGRVEILLNLWTSLRSPSGTVAGSIHKAQPSRPVDDTIKTYVRVLGDELRKARKQRGWTRRDLQRQLRSDITLQTLATYELGTRQCSIGRLAEICLALGIFPSDLLAEVDRRTWTKIQPVTVDLVAVLEDAQPELRPLRRWAAGRLRETPRRATTEYRIGIEALEKLADLCGLDSIELMTRLQKM